jgi:hypothetical protein
MELFDIVPSNVNQVTAITAGAFGLAITSSSAPPELQLNLAGGNFGVIRSSIPAPAFILEMSDRIDGAFEPAPANIHLEEFFLFQKPMQFFRLKKP